MLKTMRKNVKSLAPTLWIVIAAFIITIFAVWGGGVGGSVGSQAANTLVWVGKEGKVEGNIKSPSVISEGEIVGNIESAKHVELRAECRMTGNNNTENLAIADGCSFKGVIRMQQKGDKPVRFTEKRKKGRTSTNSK